ncbi:oxidoreductase [Aurantiacibacter rhizosphaerae]|uniref:SDR family NAD(P)-dependent oxidoreductase n=1 Tax=Aurantiacibacter rhizosphaerae TaxID=2691582 RepID=A0A844XDS9_9SPHN|nr:oxidoreductase [Aurantiacibacter rhizosphaerae]MWV27748.1 SDR family NAD(P)-dependent oxidoreductase [Aurantiacibacter rhizosphaerae]
MSFTPAEIPLQSGKTAIVTGSNTGIGFAIAETLAAKGARVLLACRDGDKAAEAIRKIEGGKEQGGEVEYLHLDLANIASVREAAEAAMKEKRIDLLINNAGVMMPPFSTATAGCELQFAVNHLGHFAFTSLLLDKLEEHNGARVVMQSSLAHRRADIDFDNLDGSKGYDKSEFYSQSKLANLLFANELNRRLRAKGSETIALACHPGIAATELMRHIKGEKIFSSIVGTVLNDSDQGALPALQAATDPAAQGGDYYGPYGLMEVRGSASGRGVQTKRARDKELAKRLWDKSIELTGVDPGLPPA